MNNSRTPSRPPATINDIEQIIASALEALRPAPLSQKITAAFPYLLPSGMRLRVQLEEDGRKKRSTAAASNWNPETGEIVLYYERADSTSDSNPSAESQSGSKSSWFATSERLKRITNDELQSLDAPETTPLQIQQCCEALAEAEKAGKAFIALKQFRDTALVDRGYPWADSLAHRQAVIAKAIELGAIITSPIPNPKAPQHPTTTVKLNRESEYAKTVTRRFQPIRPRGGESASEIILRDRGRLQILHFIDTSALIKLYVEEKGSENMYKFANAEDDRNKVVSALASVEARSGICRLRREKAYTPAEASVTLAALADDLRRMIEQPVTPPVLELAGVLVDATCFAPWMLCIWERRLSCAI